MLTDAVRADLEARGHEVLAVGPVRDDVMEGEAPQEWAEVGRGVGELVAGGPAGSGVLFCWTGTGASIAANKVPGVRAALCTDAATAAGARRWNDANVLVMSLRLTTAATARRCSMPGSPPRPIPLRPRTSSASRPTTARFDPCRMPPAEPVRRCGWSGSCGTRATESSAGSTRSAGARGRVRSRSPRWCRRPSTCAACATRSS